MWPFKKKCDCKNNADFKEISRYQVICNLCDRKHDRLIATRNGILVNPVIRKWDYNQMVRQFDDLLESVENNK